MKFQLLILALLFSIGCSSPTKAYEIVLDSEQLKELQDWNYLTVVPTDVTVPWFKIVSEDGPKVTVKLARPFQLFYHPILRRTGSAPVSSKDQGEKPRTWQSLQGK